jgi:hypothetical protein
MYLLVSVWRPPALHSGYLLTLLDKFFYQLHSSMPGISFTITSLHAKFSQPNRKNVHSCTTKSKNYSGFWSVQMPSYSDPFLLTKYFIKFINFFMFFMKFLSPLICEPWKSQSHLVLNVSILLHPLLTLMTS